MKSFDKITEKEIFLKLKQIKNEILSRKNLYYSKYKERHGCYPKDPITEDGFYNLMFEIDCMFGLNLINDYNALQTAMKLKIQQAEIKKVEEMFYEEKGL